MTAQPSPQASIGLRVIYTVYQVIAHLLLPVVLIVFRRRARREPLYWSRLGERFGAGPPVPPGAVWIYATSLGETRAVSPVIRRLIGQGDTVILTHSSPAGLTEGQRLFPGDIAAGRVVQSYQPLDLFWTVGRFLRRTRPRLALVVEFEIWPALMMEAHRLGVPMVQVNGNLTEKTVARDSQGIGKARLAFLTLYDLVLTKSDILRGHYVTGGVPAERIEIVGELKFDQAGDPDQISAANALRSMLPSDRPVFLIASSVEDEEPQLDRVVAELLVGPARPVIVWVPRSPQRFAAVAARLRDNDVAVALRSEALDCAFAGRLPDGTDVLVGDSLGEMGFYYGLADLVFVGASLVDHGGHNIIEPLAQGRPVLMGPSTYGIRFPAEEAAHAGAFESLPDTDRLIARATHLLSTPADLAAMARHAQAFHAQHTGAADRTMAQLAPYLTSR